MIKATLVILRSSSQPRINKNVRLSSVSAVIYHSDIYQVTSGGARSPAPTVETSTTHLFLFRGLVHFSLQEIDEFGLLRNCAFHFHLLMRVENLKPMETRLASEADGSFTCKFLVL